VVAFKSVKNRLFCQKIFVYLEYGTHKPQAMIFWRCIQDMNQQNVVTIHLSISIRVLNKSVLR